MTALTACTGPGGPWVRLQPWRSGLLPARMGKTSWRRGPGCSRRRGGVRVSRRGQSGCWAGYLGDSVIEGAEIPGEAGKVSDVPSARPADPAAVPGVEKGTNRRARGALELLRLLPLLRPDVLPP